MKNENEMKNGANAAQNGGENLAQNGGTDGGENVGANPAQLPKNAARLRSVVRAADSLTLGIQIVVSVAVGTGLGLGAMRLVGGYFGGAAWLFGGVALGIAAAVNCVYKVYKTEQESYAQFDKTAVNAGENLRENAGENGANLRENSRENSCENQPKNPAKTPREN